MTTLTRSLALALGAAGCLAAPDGRHHGEPLGAWPPAGAALAITSAQVHDLDGDGTDDLVVADTGADPAVYVLLGGRAGLGASYHGRVATEVAARSFDVADLDGDGLEDLVTLGQGASTGRLAAYLATAPTAFADPLTADAPELAADPGVGHLVRAVDLAGDGRAAVIAAIDTHVFAGTPGSLDPVGFGDVALTDVVPDGLVGIADAYVVPRDGHRDLVVPAAFAVVVFPAVDAGFAGLESTPTTGGNVVSARCVIDGAPDAAPEVVGGHDFDWGATAPYPTGVTAGYADGPELYAPGPVAARCAELGGASDVRPEVAVLFAAGGTPARQVRVLPDLRWVSGATPTVTSSAGAVTTIDVPAAVVGDVLVDGDFDGDGGRELLVVGTDGEIACFEGAEGGACPW